MTRLVTVNPEEPDLAIIKQAADILKAGGLLAYPTETFYALGADALNPEALERLFLLKERDLGKPVPVIAASKEMLKDLVKDFPVEAEALAQRFWPGPLTMVLKAQANLPKKLLGPGPSLAARISCHPVAQCLVETVGNPLTATSANLSGKPELLTAKEIESVFSGKLDMILDGGPVPTSVGRRAPSTIVDLTGHPRLLREGAIPAQEVMRILES